MSMSRMVGGEYERRFKADRDGRQRVAVVNSGPVEQRRGTSTAVVAAVAGSSIAAVVVAASIFAGIAAAPLVDAVSGDDRAPLVDAISAGVVAVGSVVAIVADRFRLQFCGVLCVGFLLRSSLLALPEWPLPASTVPAMSSSPIEAPEFLFFFSDSHNIPSLKARHRLFCPSLRHQSPAVAAAPSVWFLCRRRSLRVPRVRGDHGLPFALFR
eukprot:CAMPEP_0174913458 /NCGR_PEP_ID=MMETSP0167-20121228/80331_1 /TAXON_ID=38298 /ORGANISM="Rhodella maculata, Strain CCMP736" /LENGTH=211 /DNA_ID=CAMNT_0016158179 /DNA_START=1813 /DNA_END=2446 /DNA_ORIENTATION=-